MEKLTIFKRFPQVWQNKMDKIWNCSGIDSLIYQLRNCEKHREIH